MGGLSRGPNGTPRSAEYQTRRDRRSNRTKVRKKVYVVWYEGRVASIHKTLASAQKRGPSAPETWQETKDDNGKWSWAKGDQGENVIITEETLWP